MKISKFFATILLIAVCPLSKAALITDYQVGSSPNIVLDSANNIEWLQWTETVGMSIDDALLTYSADGWFLATSAMMADLFNSFDLSYGSFVWDTDDNTAQAYNSGTDGDIELGTDREKIFVSLFGNTFTNYTSDDGTTSSNDLEYSGAFFGSDLDSDGLYNFAFVYDDVALDTNSSNVIQNNGRAEMRADSNTSSDSTGARAGVALVRYVSTTPISVTSPSSVLILSLSIIFLSIRKNRYIRKTF